MKLSEAGGLGNLHAGACGSKLSIVGTLSIAALVLLHTGNPLRAVGEYGQLWSLGDDYYDINAPGVASPTLIESGIVAVAGVEGNRLWIRSDGTLMGLGSNHSPIIIDTGVIAVSSGGRHKLYVKSDGTLMGMGDNEFGQLGDGTTTDRTTPIEIDSDVVAISAAYLHSLYVKADGTLMAMGWNAYGQLGDGTTTSQTSPITVDHDVVSCSGATWHNLYLKSDGTLMVMGINENGQLGDGTTTDRHSPIEIDSDVVSISAGHDYSLYAKADGTLMGMGAGVPGQLGGSTEVFWSVTPVIIDSDVVTIAAGLYPLYVKSDGTLTTWVGYPAAPIIVDDDVFGVAGSPFGSGAYFLKGPIPEAVFGIVQPPQSYTAEPGSSATFTVVTGGVDGEAFEWKHGDTVVGGNSATLTLPNVQAADAGQYTVTVTANGESISSRSVTLGVKAPPYTEKLMNISTRGQILTGTKIMIAGFVLEGSGQKAVLIRGIGPTLGQWVQGICTDPKLALFRNTNPPTPSFAENDDWVSLPGDIPGQCQRLGAFAFLDGSHDAAIYMPLEPGPYTAKVSGVDGTGVGLVELYDADLDPLASTCNLSNISTRGEVGTKAQVLIAGFVIVGEVPKQVLVRGIGPRLADFQVADTLIDPYLQILKDASPAALWVASNDNWSDNANAADIVIIGASVGAFDLVANSKDAAILTWLEPGTYTAKVSGVGETTGVALVEVYEVK